MPQGRVLCPPSEEILQLLLIAHLRDQSGGGGI